MASAACGVGQQYGLKLLVDSVAGPASIQGPVLFALGLFFVLIALEAALARLTGWLTCRTTVGVGVGLRIELFDHLGGHTKLGSTVRYLGIEADDALVMWEQTDI